MQIKKNGIPTTMKAISRGHNIETCGPGATEHTPGITAVGVFLVIGACMTALATSGRVFSIAPSRQDIITSNGHNGQVHPYAGRHTDGRRKACSRSYNTVFVKCQDTYNLISQMSTFGQSSQGDQSYPKIVVWLGALFGIPRGRC